MGKRVRAFPLKLTVAKIDKIITGIYGTHMRRHLY
jgi:hypothetical protein